MKTISVLIVLILVGINALFAISSWNYPAPEGVIAHPDYLVEARLAGTSNLFEPIFTYSMQVCKNRDAWDGSSKPWIYDYTAVSMFDAPDTMEIRITKVTAGEISSVAIRPLSKGVVADVSGMQISFFISGPVKLSVEINGEMYRNLNLIANPVETDIPSQSDPNVIWFGPGVHNITGSNGTGVLQLLSNQTLYLAPGSVVKGAIQAENASNVKIRGRGILTAIDFADDSWQWAIEAWRCPNFLLEGILVTGSPDNTTVLSDCSGMIIRNFKVISGRHWDDAIHINAGKNILIEDCYTRGSDDNLVFYGGNCVNYSANKWTGVNQDIDNVRVENCVAWSDVAHPIMIGTHGVFATGGSVLQNISFRNIDILEHRSTTYQSGIYQGTMSITANDDNVVKNILFEDIRVERFTQGQLFHIQTNTNTDYSAGPGELVDSITFRRISYTGNSSLEAPSALKCQDASHLVKNIVFDYCHRNGAIIKDAASGNLSLGSSVQNVTYLYPENGEPYIFRQPIDAIINSGKTAVLTVVAASESTLYYQWYEGESGDISNPIPDANFATFTTPILTSNTKFWVKISTQSENVNSATALVTAIPTAEATVSVIFNVKKQHYPTKGVSINFNNQTLLTDTLGIAVFTGITTNQSLEYKMYTQGYDTLKNTIQIDLLNQVVSHDFVRKLPTYTDQFDDNVLSTFFYPENSEAYVLSEINGEQIISVNKTSPWTALLFRPDSFLLDLSSSPRISVRLKSDKLLNFQLGPVSFNEAGNQNVVPNNNSPLFVPGDNTFRNYYFDFSEKFAANGIDRSDIEKVFINFNPGSSFSGTVVIDEIIFGDSVEIKSHDALLSQITVNGEILPNFNPATLLYSYTFDDTTQVIPTIVATPTHVNAVVVITPPVNLLGNASARTANIDVRAEDNVTIKQYKITFKQPVVNSTIDARDLNCKLFPNPVSNTLYIQTDIVFDEVDVFTISGKILSSYAKYNKSKTFSVDVSNLKNGLYFVRLKNNNRILNVYKFSIAKHPLL